MRGNRVCMLGNILSNCLMLHRVILFCYLVLHTARFVEKTVVANCPCGAGFECVCGLQGTCETG